MLSWQQAFPDPISLSEPVSGVQHCASALQVVKVNVSKEHKMSYVHIEKKGFESADKVLNHTLSFWLLFKIKK